jgi:hypothetical protein
VERERDRAQLPERAQAGVASGGDLFDYWSEEIWRGPYSIDEEQGAETLALLADLVNAL